MSFVRPACSVAPSAGMYSVRAAGRRDCPFQSIRQEIQRQGLYCFITDCLFQIHQPGAALVTVLPDDSVSGIALETFVAFPLLFVFPAVCGVAGFALTGLK